MQENRDLPQAKQVFPGVWKVTLGAPERHTPTTVFDHSPAVDSINQLPTVTDCPIDLATIVGKDTDRGYLLSLPLKKDEQVYGLGLQLMSFNQRGKKKMLRINSDPVADTGDSHAPVPFYVTTEGYGVLFDTLRYMTIYCGGANRADNVVPTDAGSQTVVSGSQELYQSRSREGSAEVIAEIPRSHGIDIYIFAGPNMREAVQRYNLFSGGGCLPPRWGLGVWYRCKSDYTHDAVLDRAKYFRNSKIPCDVLGLEPGWQTRSYSNSHIWSDRFPDPALTMSTLAKDNFKINLWTHAFIHPTSPLFDSMKSKAGDFLVWGGIVPDFADPKARQTFADFYEKTHVNKGTSGYKLDECDGSDFIGSPWSFPEFSRYPSGLDGEQMHSAFGNLFLQTINGIYEGRNQRTYGEVRAAHALSAPFPYVFYSDLYDHTCFLRGVVNSGFSGLLWAPEVRDADTAEDLIRRVQAVVFSPQAIVNAWYIKNAPWDQWITDENNADRFQEDREWVTEICRNMLQLRMKFLPYIYAAFVEYQRTGMPPFRALVMDDPSDPNLWKNDLEYMMGDRVLVAPVVAGQQAREVYLPKGGWRDFWNGKYYEGGQTYRLGVPIDKILVFVKDNCILPLAGNAQHANDPALFELDVTVFGNGERGATLFEDDGDTYAYRQGAVNQVDLTWNGKEINLKRTGNTDVPQYHVKTTKGV